MRQLALNHLSPMQGSKTKKTRLGRGVGSKGKTCGHGHKGQHARCGGYHKVGFEGGQMPLQRRLPKSGFRSRKALYCAEVALNKLITIEQPVIDIAVLKSVGIVNRNIVRAKIILGKRLDTLTSAIVIRGLAVSAQVKKIIEAANGRVE